MEITEKDIIKLAKAYALYAFRNSDYTKEYWKEVVAELNKVKIQIVKGEGKNERNLYRKNIW